MIPNLTLVPIADGQLLDQLRALPDEGEAVVAGTHGDIVRRIDTPSGSIVIGGRGPNQYYLDKMSGVNVVIDLGGAQQALQGAA